MTTAHKYRKKLIEVDLPLAEISHESAREGAINYGHPSTLHQWWARIPLAACRAVIFASLVDDPSSCPDEFPTEEEQRAERERLHAIIHDLVIWKNTDESKPGARALKDRARYEIARSIARSRGSANNAPTEPAAVLRYLADNAPPIYDPFAGGGSIPLEAQRLGMRAVASDLNPVAVLINKALIELPPKFANQPPVNPNADGLGMPVGKGRRARRVPWRGTAGLADDIRYYGRWMQEKAFDKIGHLYPKAKLPDGREATVIAWLWARTIPCPNPACGIAMPMMKTFCLSTRPNNRSWIKPNHNDKGISFEVQDHAGDVPQKGTVNRTSATCIACNTAVRLSYVRDQSKAGNMGTQMTAIVAEGTPKRFVSSYAAQIRAAYEDTSKKRPNQKIPLTARKVSGRGYGITRWHELFTERQLIALTTISDLIPKVHTSIQNQGASKQYADAVCTYLSLAIGRTTSGNCAFTRWRPDYHKIEGPFGRQAIPMIWDFAEANLFSNKTQSWMNQINWVAKVVERIPAQLNTGLSHQADASMTIHADSELVFITDPPYYDNISYAELSDFFYVWLRPLLRDIYPDIFASILAPTRRQMIAAPQFKNPRKRFEKLMNKTLCLMRERCSPEFPSSIFYAYNQQRAGRASTGWETMLSAIMSSGFRIVGTWPMRTVLPNRLLAIGTNALATSVVLVCRPRPDDAPVATFGEFRNALEREMPAALERLQRESHIAPTDLAQAAIGPGMEIYSRYASVITLAGEPVPVSEALSAINTAIANYDRRQTGEMDAESRFCLDWHFQHGYGEGDYGDAEALFRAHNAAPDAMRDRLLTAERGKVRLLPPSRYGADSAIALGRMSAWEGCLRMAWHFSSHEDKGLVEGAARVARRMEESGADVESVERLARVMYNRSDAAGDSKSAVMFNALATEWSKIRAAMERPRGDRLIG